MTGLQPSTRAQKEKQTAGAKRMTSALWIFVVFTVDQPPWTWKAQVLSFACGSRPHRRASKWTSWGSEARKPDAPSWCLPLRRRVSEGLAPFLSAAPSPKGQPLPPPRASDAPVSLSTSPSLPPRTPTPRGLPPAGSHHRPPSSPSSLSRGPGRAPQPRPHCPPQRFSGLPPAPPGSGSRAFLGSRPPRSGSSD